MNQLDVPLLTSHCSRCTVRYFGFRSLKWCPECLTVLATFEIPFPFVSAVEATDCILLKPSVGDFLRNYNIGDDLHIGVCSETGEVVSFDKNGLQVDDADQWTQCLVLLDRSDLPLSSEAWNTKLEQVATMHDWTPERYSPQDRNCFDFVLQFLDDIGTRFASDDKLSFVRDYVQKPLNRQAKFTRVYRRCLSKGVVRVSC